MDGRDASFVRVREILSTKIETNLYLFPNSMSNSSIGTSAIDTLPRSSSFKRSLGNFGTSSSSPFLNARNLKQMSLKMFVLRLFGKFVPFYPTLVGCRQFHSTHKVGPWTLLTSNPSNVLLAALKTGEVGVWLTAVARWHMRYLLRSINRRLHDRATELCVNKSRTVCRALFAATAAPSPTASARALSPPSSARTPPIRNHPTRPFTPHYSCSPSFNSFFNSLRGFSTTAGTLCLVLSPRASMSGRAPFLLRLGPRYSRVCMPIRLNGLQGMFYSFILDAADIL
jgi:hypothetical protein